MNSMDRLKSIRSRTQFYANLKISFTHSILSILAVFFIHRTIIIHLSTADIDSFICPFVHCAFFLSWQKRRYGKHLQRMSDKCSGGGVIGPHVIFSSFRLHVATSSGTHAGSWNSRLTTTSRWSNRTKALIHRLLARNVARLVYTIKRSGIPAWVRTTSALK